MSAVAERLGVPITVLYGYVANKDEMVRLAAARAAQGHQFPADEGQHWTVYVASHAMALFDLLIGPGQLISQYFAGGLGPEVELDRAEAWLEGMTRHGFDPTAALLLHRQMGEIVIGGAVTVLHGRSLETAGTKFEDIAKRAINSRADTEIPLLRSAQATFSRRVPLWPRTLVQLLEAAAAERGEAFDRQPVLSVLNIAP